MKKMENILQMDIFFKISNFKMENKNFISWDRNKKNKYVKSEKSHFMPLYCLVALNDISYSSGRGLCYNEKITVDLSDPMFYQCVWHKLKDTYRDEMGNEFANYGIVPKKMLKASKLRFPHRKITIISSSQWLNTPDEWYEKTAGETHALPPISSRPYIHIENKFKRVSLDSFEKRSRLTVEDVLFACRALCKDGTRDYDGGFDVINDQNGHLELQVDIDNFSS